MACRELCCFGLMHDREGSHVCLAEKRHQSEEVSSPEKKKKKILAAGKEFGLEQPIATGPANGLFRNAAYITQRVKQTNMRPKKSRLALTSMRSRAQKEESGASHLCGCRASSVCLPTEKEEL